MKTLTKTLLTCLAITALGAVLICIPSAIPAGIVALAVGGMGMMFAPLISMAIEESK